MKKVLILTEDETAKPSLNKIIAKADLFDKKNRPKIQVVNLDPKVSLKNTQAIIPRVKSAVSIEEWDTCILLIDLEDIKQCPGIRASNFENVIRKGLSLDQQQNFHVVIKVKCYESWLIAGITRNFQPFKFAKNQLQQIESRRAENFSPKEATEFLDKALGAKKFRKGQHCKSIAEAIDPEDIQRRSRSFRRFARLLGDQRYSNSSKKYISKQ